MTKQTVSQVIFSANCAKRMADAGLKQKEVEARAALVGRKINQTTVGRNMKPTGNATLRTVDAVASVLGLATWQMLMPENVSQLPTQDHPKLRRICDIALVLNDDGLTSLLAHAEFLDSSPKYRASKNRKT